MNIKEVTYYEKSNRNSIDPRLIFNVEEESINRAEEETSRAIKKFSKKFFKSQEFIKYNFKKGTKLNISVTGNAVSINTDNRAVLTTSEKSTRLIFKINTIWQKYGRREEIIKPQRLASPPPPEQRFPTRQLPDQQSVALFPRATPLKRDQGTDFHMPDSYPPPYDVEIIENLQSTEKRAPPPPRGIFKPLSLLLVRPEISNDLHGTLGRPARTVDLIPRPLQQPPTSKVSSKIVRSGANNNSVGTLPKGSNSQRTRNIEEAAFDLVDSLETLLTDALNDGVKVKGLRMEPKQPIKPHFIEQPSAILEESQETLHHLQVKIDQLEKDLRTTQLVLNASQMGNAFNKMIAPARQEGIQILQNKNKSLKNKIEIKNTRIDFLNRTLDKAEKQLAEFKEPEHQSTDRALTTMKIPAGLTVMDREITPELYEMEKPMEPELTMDRTNKQSVRPSSDSFIEQPLVTVSSEKIAKLKKKNKYLKEKLNNNEELFKNIKKEKNNHYENEFIEKLIKKCAELQNQINIIQNNVGLETTLDQRDEIPGFINPDYAKDVEDYLIKNVEEPYGSSVQNLSIFELMECITNVHTDIGNCTNTDDLNILTEVKNILEGVRKDKDQIIPHQKSNPFDLPINDDQPADDMTLSEENELLKMENDKLRYKRLALKDAYANLSHRMLNQLSIVPDTMPDLTIGPRSEPKIANSYHDEQPHDRETSASVVGYDLNQEMPPSQTELVTRAKSYLASTTEKPSSISFDLEEEESALLDQVSIPALEQLITQITAHQNNKNTRALDEHLLDEHLNGLEDLLTLKRLNQKAEAPKENAIQPRSGKAKAEKRLAKKIHPRKHALIKKT